jgi:large subunit ribosomal protein L22
MSYSFQKYNPEKMAIAVGKSLPVSTKHCIELTGRIRRKSIESAKRILNDVIEMRKPIAFKRYTGSVGHKRGMAAGRYPVKAAGAVLRVLESCEANAQFKGLDTGSMVIVHSNAQLGGKQYHYGRQRRRIMKRTMVEIVLEETGKSVKDKKPAKEVKQEKTDKQSQEKPAAEKTAEKKEAKKPLEKPVPKEKPTMKKKANVESDKANEKEASSEATQ